MAGLTETIDVAAVAREAVASLATHEQISPFSSRPGGLTLADAYRVTPLLRAAFEARGEKILGRKIGFTNRNIWAQYGVYAPIWGYVTDRTTRDLLKPSSSFRGAPDGSDPAIQKQRQSSRLDSEPGPAGRPGTTDKISTARVADFAEPRIEPEIMFGLAAAPSPGMDDTALLSCIAWIAHGFEIVQSIFPDWKFSPADTIAADGLHAALLIGPRHDIGSRAGEWLRTLARFEIELYCDGQLMDRGYGSNVLEGPLSAVRHLVDLLAHDPDNPPLAAGEIISTGTLTRALPVKAGETWTTKLKGIALEGASLRYC